MIVFGRDRGQKQQPQVIEVWDATKKIATVTKGLKHVSLVYNGSLGRNADFNPPPFDLPEMANIISTESLARRAVDKYVEQVWKRGYEFIGDNQDAINYLRTRFDQIAMVTKTPTSELFRSIAEQLVSYSNCFIAKIRNPMASGGHFRRIIGKTNLVPPVAGYEVIDAT